MLACGELGGEEGRCGGDTETLSLEALGSEAGEERQLRATVHPSGIAEPKGGDRAVSQTQVKGAPRWVLSVRSC